MIERDVDYAYVGVRMRGLLIAEPGATHTPTIVLIHDAFGLGGFSLDAARRHAEHGWTVFAADVWGERRTVHDDREVGPLIAAMVHDRETWLGRVTAAHAAARAQREVDPGRIVTLGYCFGGSSALEFARTGADVRGVVAVHPGLDLIDPAAAWTPAPGLAVLLALGADDPMATAAQRDALQSAMSAAAVDWWVDLYSDTTHAFTNPRLARSSRPEVAAYRERSARRTWDTTVRFLSEIVEITAEAQQRATARTERDNEER